MISTDTQDETTRQAERGVPCICSRQFEADPPVGVPVAASNSREITVELLRCTGCVRTWKRVNG